MRANSRALPVPALEVLLVEDTPEDAELTIELLHADPERPVNIALATTVAQALETVPDRTWDVILLDLGLPDSQGLEALEKVLGAAPGAPVVVLTGFRDEAAGLEAVKRGAQDFLAKDRLEKPVLWRSIQYARERYHLQGRLEAQNHILREQKQELEEFAQVLSHDLRAPLRAMIQYAGIMAGDLEGRVNAETAHSLHRIADNARRMFNMVDGLLDCARLGRSAEKAETMRIDEAVRRIVAALKPAPGFQVQCVGGERSLTTNWLQLSRVLQNLIGNALHHHDKTAGTVWVICEANGNATRFRVDDDGPGIPADFKPRLFEMFQRVARPGAPDGAGLGLYIVRKLVGGQGGEVSFVPGGGRGASFQVVWPTRPRRQPRTPADPGNVAPIGAGVPKAVRPSLGPGKPVRFQGSPVALRLHGGGRSGTLGATRKGSPGRGAASMPKEGRGSPAP